MAFPHDGKKFKKGESGNPEGKPKGIEHSSTRLKRLLELTQKMKNPVTNQDEDFSVAEQMDLALIIKARKGDVTAYREIMDRLEGKPQSKVQVDGAVSLILKEGAIDPDDEPITD